MHPAFSVIFFTTFSGAGFGLLAWVGLLALGGGLPPRGATLLLLALGAALAAGGLLSSLLHLGKPSRAWRAFSQWRSSWLSREGVFSLATFLPVLWLGWLVLRGEPIEAGAVDDRAFQYIGIAPAYLAVASSESLRFVGTLLTLLALASVVCTAMIYASLKPVPAWSHPLVLPVYLMFALFTGGLLTEAVIAVVGNGTHNRAGLGALFAAVLLWRIKRRYWRDIDRGVLPASRASALGLPADRTVRVFEHPHTEANYLTKEMGFVLARKHSRKLRFVAVLLFAGLPALCALPVWLLPQIDGAPWMAVAALSAVLGILVERWLFFAEARHVVTLYY